MILSAHSTLYGEHSTRIRLIIANGDDLLKRRLAAHQGVAIQFRTRDDKIREKLLPARRIKAEPFHSRLRTIGHPSYEPGVNPPTTDPASADSAEICATSMASPQPYGSSLP